MAYEQKDSSDNRIARQLNPLAGLLVCFSMRMRTRTIMATYTPLPTAAAAADAAKIQLRCYSSKERVASVPTIVSVKPAFSPDVVYINWYARQVSPVLCGLFLRTYTARKKNRDKNKMKQFVVCTIVAALCVASASECYKILQLLVCFVMC